MEGKSAASKKSFRFHNRLLGMKIRMGRNQNKREQGIEK